MAKIEKIELVDDIDGGEAEHALEFAVNGVRYEIDLSSANQAEFDTFIEKYVKAGRRAGAPARAARQRASSQPRQHRRETAEIRRWAEANGIEVATRGRIPSAVLERYRSETGAA